MTVLEAAQPAGSPASARQSNDYGRDWPLHQRFPGGAGNDDPLGCAARPTWRGGVHLIALCAAAPTLVLLIILANGPRATVGVSIYATGMCAMFAASTTYHRWVHSYSLRAAWRRADHAMIFAAIAGSTTPVVLVEIPSAWGVALLVVVWSAAVLGAVLKLGPWASGDAIGTVLYAVVSALAALALPALWIHGGVAPTILYLTSGFLYIFGARWFSKTWPRLKPAVFSYHEVWHVFTVLAATAHFLVVWSIAT